MQGSGFVAGAGTRTVVVDEHNVALVHCEVDHVLADDLVDVLEVGVRNLRAIAVKHVAFVEAARPRRLRQLPPSLPQRAPPARLAALGGTGTAVVRAAAQYANEVRRGCVRKRERERFVRSCGRAAGWFRVQDRGVLSEFEIEG